MALLGNRGCGKTQLAVSVIQSACESGRSSRYVKRVDLSRMVRRTYDSKGETEADVIDDLVAVDLLVIDEMHQVTDTDFDRNLLVNILDRRYDEERATILVGNDSRGDFAASVGPSVISRIHETGEALECDWPSYRKPGMWRQAGAASP